MRDVSNGDRNDEAAFVGRIGIGLGEYGIVVIAGIDGIDRDERQLGQIQSALRLDGRQRLDFSEHTVGKAVGQAVNVDGDQADLALILRIAEALRDARLGHALAMTAHDVEAHELTVVGFAFVTGAHWPFLEILAVDRIDHAAATALGGAENAEQALSLARQALDRLGSVRVAEGVGIADASNARQNAVADRKCAVAIGADRSAALLHEDLRALAFGCFPVRRNSNEFALVVARDNLQHADRRQLAARLEGLAIAHDRAVRRKLREESLQGNAILATDVEGAGNLALADLLRGAGQVFEQLLTRRQRRLLALVARLTRPVRPIGFLAALLLLRHARSFS